MSLIKALLFSASIVSALEWADGTGKLPALGWNSWNAYHCDINETLILDAANAMIKFGFQVNFSLFLSNNEMLTASPLSGCRI